VDEVMLNRLRARIFPLLTESVYSNKMLIVPPGEAAYFISAAQIEAAPRTRAPP
jgi:hypothetical protein